MEEVGQDCSKDFLSDLKKYSDAFNENTKNFIHNHSMIKNVKTENICKRKKEAENILLHLQKIEKSFEDSLNNEENNLDENQINNQMINMFEKWNNLLQCPDIFENYNQKQNLEVIFKKLNDFFSIYKKSTTKKQFVEICSILSKICSENVYKSTKVKEFIESLKSYKTPSIEIKNHQIDQDKVSSRKTSIKLWRQEKLKYIYEFVSCNLGNYKSEEVWILFDANNPEVVSNIDIKSSSIDVTGLMNIEFTKSTLSILLAQIENLLKSANG